MSRTLQEEFAVAVAERLALLDNQIVPVLERLIAHRYPSEVVALDFEVFPNGFVDGFPVRAFFMDSDNCEHFVYENGQTTYPSPVDPDLLNLPDGVYDRTFEEPFWAEDPDLDTFALAGETLVLWFAERWIEAGGTGFYLSANIAMHDDSKTFDLIAQEWRERQ